MFNLAAFFVLRKGTSSLDEEAIVFAALVVLLKGTSSLDEEAPASESSDKITTVSRFRFCG